MGNITMTFRETRKAYEHFTKIEMPGSMTYEDALKTLVGEYGIKTLEAWRVEFNKTDRFALRKFSLR